MMNVSAAESQKFSLRELLTAADFIRVISAVLGRVAYVSFRDTASAVAALEHGVRIAACPGIPSCEHRTL